MAGDAIAGAVAERYRSVAGESDAASLDELTAEEFSSVAEDRNRYAWLSPIVITTIAILAASLVAARGLLGPGSLAGPALLPAAGTLTEAWRAVVDPIAGAPGQVSPPWLALVALGSTVFAGRPEWFVTSLICGVVPLSLLTAYPVIRRMINDRRVRWWAAITYALLPALLGGTNQGRLALSVVAIGLPLLAMAARALVLRRIRTPEAWRGGWGAGVVLMALLAFEPALIFFVVLVAVIGVVVLRRTPRKAGRVLIALGVPLVVLLPWWPSLITAPGRLFVGPDSLLDGVPTAPDVWRLLLGRGLGVGLPPLWLGAVVFGMVWLLALLGLARRVQRRAVVAGWVTALSGFGMAVFALPSGGFRPTAGRRGPALARDVPADRVRRADLRRRGRHRRPGPAARRRGASPGCSHSRWRPGSRLPRSAWAARPGGCGPERAGPWTAVTWRPSRRTC